MTHRQRARAVHAAALIAFAIAVGCYALATTAAANGMFVIGFALECVAWALAIGRVRAA